MLAKNPFADTVRIGTTDEQTVIRGNFATIISVYPCSSVVKLLLLGWNFGQPDYVKDDREPGIERRRFC